MAGISAADLDRKMKGLDSVVDHLVGLGVYQREVRGPSAPPRRFAERRPPLPPPVPPQNATRIKLDAKQVLQNLNHINPMQGSFSERPHSGLRDLPPRFHHLVHLPQRPTTGAPCRS